jgi:hypothetical protein
LTGFSSDVTTGFLILVRKVIAFMNVMAGVLYNATEPLWMGHPAQRVRF